jgi:hypothetical protein
VSEHVPAMTNYYEENEMNQPHFTTERISDGLDFGHGEISSVEDPEILRIMDETIRGPEILVPIDKDDAGKIIDDDGCGDGRGTKVVFTLTETYKRSLNRAKVFGGAVAMTAASLIGTGRAHELPLPEVFETAISELEKADIDFGAHTDEDAHGESCGCGAIDKAPQAFLAALKYEAPIRAVIDSLGIEGDQLDTVYSNLRSYIPELATYPDYSGSKVMEKIIQKGKVVKQLAGGHREKAIVLNTVRGYTVNQEIVRQATAGRAQVFAVDIWRLQDIAGKLNPSEPVEQQQAYLSGLVYTLAIAAVLTKGDLPVYMTQAQEETVQLAA